MRISFLKDSSTLAVNGGVRTFIRARFYAQNKRGKNRSDCDG